VGGIFEWLVLGGPVMAVLGVLSVAVATLSIIKVWEFSEARVWKREFVEPALAAWQEGRADLALSQLAGVNGPLADVMAAAMRACSATDCREPSVRERIAQHATDRLEQARGLLRPLEVIATLAPLLGLLGTVLGMIQVFRRLQAAGERVDPGILSGGLWEALLTTAAGLGVAIVALCAFHFLDRQVERLQHAMESALTRILAVHAPGG
jgi:biopolymer transport protein ExbB